MKSQAAAPIALHVEVSLQMTVAINGWGPGQEFAIMCITDTRG